MHVAVSCNKLPIDGAGVASDLHNTRYSGCQNNNVYWKLHNGIKLDLLALRASIAGVSVGSMFLCGQCFGAVFAKVNLIFKAPQGLALAGKFNASMWSLLFVFWDIYLISITRTSTSPIYQLHQNIDLSKRLRMPGSDMP